MTTVAPYQDVHAEREPRELVFQRLECLHASCCDLHAQIEEISQGDVPPVVIPPDVVYSWGHETYLPSFEQPLRGIFSQRRHESDSKDYYDGPKMASPRHPHPFLFTNLNNTFPGGFCTILLYLISLKIINDYK